MSAFPANRHVADREECTDGRRGDASVMPHPCRSDRGGRNVPPRDPVGYVFLVAVIGRCFSTRIERLDPDVIWTRFGPLTMGRANPPALNALTG